MFGNTFVGGGGSGGGGDVSLIANVLLSAPAPSIDITGIPSTFKHLKLFYSLRSDRALGSDRIHVTCNGDTAVNKYGSILYYWFNPSTWGTINPGVTTSAVCTFICGNTALANSFGGGFIDFPDYANATKLKLFQTRGGQIQSIAILPEIYDGMSSWLDTSPINRITIAPFFGANFLANSDISLYGYK